FNEFKQTLEGIPPRTLAARLAELEDAGVLERQVFDTRPPRVEYRLTEAGRRLRYVVEALNTWAASAPTLPGAAPGGAAPLRALGDASAAGRLAVADMDGGRGQDLGQAGVVLGPDADGRAVADLELAERDHGRDLPLPEQEDGVAVDGEGLALRPSDQQA